MTNHNISESLGSNAASSEAYTTSTASGGVVCGVRHSISTPETTTESMGYSHSTGRSFSEGSSECIGLCSSVSTSTTTVGVSQSISTSETTTESMSYSHTVGILEGSSECIGIYSSVSTSTSTGCTKSDSHNDAKNSFSSNLPTK